jgi:pentatricopeptide repeat protein
MIFGFVKCGQGQKALDLFQLMQKEGLKLSYFGGVA